MVERIHDWLERRSPRWWEAAILAAALAWLAVLLWVLSLYI